jgi:hypothetical protein
MISVYADSQGGNHFFVLVAVGFELAYWADCTWSESEGLKRLEGESKDDFCNRVYQTTKKQFLWFD